MIDSERIKDMEFLDAVECFAKGAIVALNPAECVLITKALYSYLNVVRAESPLSVHSTERAIQRIVDWKMRPSMTALTDPAILTKEINEMELTVRASSCLKSIGINLIGELASFSEGELKATRRIGQKSINEIKKELAKLGLSLKDERCSSKDDIINALKEKEKQSTGEQEDK